MSAPVTLAPGESIIVTAAAVPVPPPPPPPVEPPPNAKTVKPATFTQAYLDGLKDGDVVLLYGGTYNVPFYIVRRKVTLQNMPGEVPILTRTGRPDILYHETDGVVRGLHFVSQSPGFNGDSQGAALAEVRTAGSPIGLVWYDQCAFLGTSKMTVTEQILYISDKGSTINEVRVTDCDFDGANTGGYGIHPYDGPSPKLVSVTGSTFANFDRNAAVLNAANACIVRVDDCDFIRTVTYARGMYGRVEVGNSRLSGNAIGTVVDKGGNTR